MDEDEARTLRRIHEGRERANRAAELIAEATRLLDEADALLEQSDQLLMGPPEKPGQLM